MLDNELDPMDSTDIARKCFASKSHKVTSDKVKDGLFPDADYSIPAGRFPKKIWFRATVDAWRKKHYALSVVTRNTIFELQKEGTAEAEAAIRAILVENMRKASEYAAQVGDELMAKHALHEQRDADHADARA